MSGQHTPGPWLLKATPWPWGFYPATAYDVAVEEVRGNEGSEYEFQTEIASVHNAAVDGKDHHPSASEAEANARLIAAAPDLLEACEAVAAADAEYAAAEGNAAIAVAIGKRIMAGEMVEAAIAKASAA